jgi:predicted RNase H-like HicB family nuclease
MRSSEERRRIHVKPLPDILDEMDANIRAAAEAVRRAEEAAKAAREAADVATKASKEAAKRAEEARIVGEKAVQDAESAVTEVSGKRYMVIFEKANDNYSAYSPDIQGCIATGKTRAEVEKNFREAISLHFTGLAEDGLPVPEPASFIEYIDIEV